MRRRDGSSHRLTRCSGSSTQVVELALGAVVHGARPVGGAHPAVAGDRAQVDVDAEQLAVPLGEHALEAAASASASSTGSGRPCIHVGRRRPAIAQNVGARSTSPTGRGDDRRRDAGATAPAARSSGSRMSASTWYGPLNSRPKSPCSSPWSVVKTTSTSSAQPRASIAREHAAERLVDQLALDGVAGVDLAHLVGGQRRRHPVAPAPRSWRRACRRTRAASAAACASRIASRSAARLAGSRRAAARRASRCGRSPTAAGPTGGAGRGSSSSRTSRRRRRASRARRSCGRRPSRCGTSSRGIGLTVTCGAPVSPPPAALT